MQSAKQGDFPTIVSLSAGIFARLFPQSQTLLWHSLIDKQAVLDDLNFVEWLREFSGESSGKDWHRIVPIDCNFCSMRAESAVIFLTF